MAQLNRRKVLLFSVVLFLSVSICFSAWFEPQHETTQFSSRRTMLGAEKEEQDKPLKKKTTTQSTKNQTKLIKPNTLSAKNHTKTIKSDNIFSSKNQTKTIKSNTKTTKLSNNVNISTKNQTKPLKLNSTNSTSKTKPTTATTLKKLNNNTAPKIKKLNITSKIPTSSKKTLDLAKVSNKTTKATATKDDNKKTKNKQGKTTNANQTHDGTTNKKQKTPPNNQQETKKKQAPPSWIMDEEGEDDLVSLSEFTDLPNKFHQTLIPDLERISTTSKAYITRANNEITKGFKPYVGKKYAPTLATVISCAFILIPLLLVSLLCTRIKAYFSLQKILIFIQVYLSIYFTILCVTSLFTGLEPLKFLYSTSRSTYLCLQVLQTLAYVFYLLLLLMYLVLVFSTECGLGSKFLGLAQIFLGFAIGLHYYVTVFHRVVLQQPPKTNWKIHGIYATCFLLISVLARADRRKKTYVEDGGGEGKKN